MKILFYTYPVALNAVQAAGRSTCGVPVALSFLDERPHERVEAVDEVSRRSAAGGHQRKEAEEADHEEEPNHPPHLGSLMFSAAFFSAVWLAIFSLIPKRIGDDFLPLKAMPEEATTQVWITVFSWRVKGCRRRPVFSRALDQILTKKNPRSPAETFSEGMTPVVRFSFITMTLNMIPRKKLTTKALKVSCCCHGGTGFPSNALSTEYAFSSKFSASSPAKPPTSPSLLFLFFMVTPAAWPLALLYSAISSSSRGNCPL
ncbi:unnamed protein product [Spirodela intermedia]|uniref:Uncharacterized protein n=1 Tax=Spirodela intermedia TaxID=51605 RepID=A0A7I8IDR5_SPIIN|nr:unnamed protein product [Spirodela intermedia]CAA6655761.1 unnamed protein product [Spirodela intermedia]